MINLIGKYPECNHDNMSVSIGPHKKKEINLECSCGFDVNLRTVIAFREIGKGLPASN